MTVADLSAIANPVMNWIRHAIKPADVAEAEPTASTENLNLCDSVASHSLVHDQQQDSSPPSEIKVYIHGIDHGGLFAHPYGKYRFVPTPLDLADWVVLEADKNLKEIQVPPTTKVLMVAPKPPGLIPDCHIVHPNPLESIASHEEKCVSHDSAPDYKVCVIGKESQRWVGDRKYVIDKGRKIELRAGKLQQGKVVLDGDMDGKEWVADGFVVLFSSRNEMISREAFEKPAVSIGMVNTPSWVGEGAYECQPDPFGPLLSRIDLRAKISHQ